MKIIKIKVGNIRPETNQRNYFQLFFKSKTGLSLKIFVGSKCRLDKGQCVLNVRADKTLMGAVVENLISNAIKYSIPKNDVFVEVGEMQDNP